MEYSIILGLCVVVILAVCLGIFIRSYLQLRKMYEELQVSCNNLEKLNRELRSQRHDYINHLQVVYGLMELEEYEELYAYLYPVYKDIMKTGKALKTTKPAINALLMAKMTEAENKGIDFAIEVKSDLKALHVEDWELCRVISNLIDNGITALEEHEGEKKLNIDISEDRQRYIMTVSNNGPQIPDQMLFSMFKPGITSKKGEGHGMGLHIVMTIINKYNGTMKVVSNAKETSFTFGFPKIERR